MVLGTGAESAIADCAFSAHADHCLHSVDVAVVCATTTAAESALACTRGLFDFRKQPDGCSCVKSGSASGDYCESGCCSDNFCKASDKCGNEDLSTIWIIAVASAMLFCCGVVAVFCVWQYSDRHSNPARITPRAFQQAPPPQAAAQQAGSRPPPPPAVRRASAPAYSMTTMTVFPLCGSCPSPTRPL